MLRSSSGGRRTMPCSECSRDDAIICSMLCRSARGARASPARTGSSIARPRAARASELTDSVTVFVPSSMVPSTMAPSSIVAPKVWAAVDLRFAAFRGGAFASIQFQKPSLSFQREGRSSRAVWIAGSFAFEISGKCTVMNSSGSPSVLSICGKVGLSDRLSASFSHRLLNMNAELAKTSSRPNTRTGSPPRTHYRGPQRPDVGPRPGALLPAPSLEILVRDVPLAGARRHKILKSASPQHGHPIIADDIRELLELDARAATGGADMAVEHCFEVVPPLVALYPLDQPLNAMDGRHECASRFLPTVRAVLHDDASGRVPCWLALSSASVTPSRPRHVSSPRHVERSMRISSHCALLFPSSQGLWDLFRRSDFRRWSYNPIALEQAQFVIHPAPTPPLPAKALSVPSALHMAPDLLFHPVFHEAKALAGMSDRIVIHPST